MTLTPLHILAREIGYNFYLGPIKKDRALSPECVSWSDIIFLQSMASRWLILKYHLRIFKSIQSY